MVYIYAMACSIIVTGIELLFREYRGIPYMNILPVVLIPAVVVNYLVYKIIGESKYFLEAFVIFSMCNMTIRLILSLFVLKERASVGVLTAYALVVIANIIRRW